MSSPIRMQQRHIDWENERLLASATAGSILTCWTRAVENDTILYFRPRVMRHLTVTGTEEFAIHEVYFGENDGAISYTEDALSPESPLSKA